MSEPLKQEEGGQPSADEDPADWGPLGASLGRCTPFLCIPAGRAWQCTFMAMYAEMEDSPAGTYAHAAVSSNDNSTQTCEMRAQNPRLNSRRSIPMAKNCDWEALTLHPLEDSDEVHASTQCASRCWTTAQLQVLHMVQTPNVQRAVSRGLLRSSDERALLLRSMGYAGLLGVPQSELPVFGPALAASAASLTAGWHYPPLPAHLQAPGADALAASCPCHH